MEIEIFAGEEADFFTRFPGRPEVLRWFRQEGNWLNVRERLPAGARPVAFGALPAELQEEILALVARLEAVGGLLWSSPN